MMNQNNGKAPLKRITKANDRMKPSYNSIANPAGFQEGDQVQLYHPN
jgi:hypothetical protein